MRSWSIPVGRLFGVDVRIHLTFLILPMFIFWTDYQANGKANGSRDLALAGIILACVAAHECGHILVAMRFGLKPKGTILLPLTGVTLYDESGVVKVQPEVVPWKREIRIAVAGPLISFALAGLAAAVVAGTGRAIDLWKWP
jgi:Zn-dependent protease